MIFKIIIILNRIIFNFSNKIIIDIDFDNSILINNKLIKLKKILSLTLDKKFKIFILNKLFR